MIDNYDSFTFNLAHLLAVVNQEEAVVISNDPVNLDELRQIQFDNVVISPGPGRPDRASDTGISRDIINDWDKPLLGVCLGHQIIAAVHGGTVIRDPHPVHGRAVPLWHARNGLFAGVPSSFRAVRYNSLAVHAPLPNSLRATAWSEDGAVQALMHVSRPMWGVQFHPESIASEHGRQILTNFRDLSRAQRPLQPRVGWAPSPAHNYVRDRSGRHMA